MVQTALERSQAAQYVQPQHGPHDFSPSPCILGRMLPPPNHRNLFFKNLHNTFLEFEVIPSTKASLITPDNRRFPVQHCIETS